MNDNARATSGTIIKLYSYQFGFRAKAGKPCSHTYAGAERPCAVKTKRVALHTEVPTPETKSPGVLERMIEMQALKRSPKGTRDRQ
jgi:hypothetical protein